MAKSPIDSANFTKNLRAMVDTLSDRAEAFQRFVVSKVAEAVLEGVQIRAPEGKDLPADYKRALEVVQVDSREASYAVVYRGKAEVPTFYDPERTVLYINLLDAKDNSKEAALFRALSRFQPFTMDTMPLDVPRTTGFVIARTVTKAETEIIRKKGNRQSKAVQKVIDTLGRGVINKAAFNANTALLFSDMAFQVLRKELGIGLSRKPHWRPALKFVTENSSFLRDLMMSDESLKLWNDPSWSGWKKLGIVKENVQESTVDDLKDFQDKLLPKGGGI